MGVGGQSFKGEHSVPTVSTLLVEQSACKMRLLSIMPAGTTMAKRKNISLSSVGDKAKLKSLLLTETPVQKQYT